MKPKQTEILFASMEHLDHDMIESAAAAMTGKKKYGSPILKWSAVAAAICVLISSLVVFAVFRNAGAHPATDKVALPPPSTATNIPTSTATPQPTPGKPFQLPASADDIVWSASEQNGPDGDASAMEWNGLWVSYPLYDALKEMDDQTYMSLIVQSNDQERVYDIFAEAGYCVTVKNGSLYLFVQKDAFANLKIANRESYLFHLASRESYEGEVSGPQDLTSDDWSEAENT